MQVKYNPLQIKESNKIKEFSDNLFSRLEDMMFNIILKVPQRFIPTPVMKRINAYMDRFLYNIAFYQSCFNA